MSTLGVWMNGRRVGTWSRQRARQDSFSYDPDWVDSPEGRPISLSLPFTAGNAPIRKPEVPRYFDNLLPDDPRIRARMRTRFGARSVATFDLLEAVGRDCVGAVQLLPADSEPEGWNRIDSAPLTIRQVEKLLEAVPTPAAPALGLDDEDDFRISIAGGQEKTALLRIGRTWHRPRGATPTSHILKLPLGIIPGYKYDLSQSVDNEWVCLELLGELGLDVAGAEIGRFGAQRVLVVRRFDRRWQNVGTAADPESAAFRPPARAWLARVPQEDFCQVTGISYDKKYEREGGPGIAQILGILAGSEYALDDRRHFALSQLAFWLLAAIDGHAKNFSIFHGRGGRYNLTPLYDVISAWPVIGSRAHKLPLQKAKLAMALRGTTSHYRIKDIHARHFRTLADSLGDEEAWPAMCAMAEHVPAAIDRVEPRLPRDFAGPVWAAVTAGLKRQSAAFLKGVRALDASRT